MERKEDWKDFGTLVRGRSDYRRWLHCEDQEEKALWKELLDWEIQISSCISQIHQTPMPAEPEDIRMGRAALHINQKNTCCDFLELLFEYSLRKEDSETLNLLFSFLEAYAGLLKKEAELCQ